MASIVKNSFYNTLGIIVYALAIVIVTPMLINTMGDVQYGLFRLALFSVVGYCVILDMGLSSGILRLLANKIVSGDLKNAHRLMGFSIYAFGFISAIIVIFIALLIVFFPSFIKTPPELVFDFRILLAATAVFLVFSFFNTIWTNIFIIKSRFDYLQLTKLAGRVAFMFMGLALMKVFGNPLLMMSISVVIITPAVFIASIPLARKVWPEMGVDFSFPDKALFKEIVCFGGQWFAITVSGIIIFSSIDVMISRYVGIAAVALFSIPLMIGNQMLSIVSSISAPAFSSAVEFGIEGKKDDLGGLYKTIIEISGLVFISFFVPIFSFMGPLLEIWINPGFGEIKWIANAVLIGYVYVVFESASQTLLKATGNIRRVSQYYVYIAAAILATVFILLKFTNFGLMGIALSLSFFAILRSIIILRNTAAQFCANWKEILSYALFRMSLTAFPAMALSITVLKLIPPDNKIVLVLYLGGSFAITFLLAYFIILKKARQNYVKTAFKSRLEKISSMAQRKKI